jgi:hypothetical protein
MRAQPPRQAAHTGHLLREGKPKTEVINIMDALKKSMQKQGQAKVRDAVRKRMGKGAPKEAPSRPATRGRVDVLVRRLIQSPS